jgi:hypothetical protein
VELKYSGKYSIIGVKNIKVSENVLGKYSSFTCYLVLVQGCPKMDKSRAMLPSNLCYPQPGYLVLIGVCLFTKGKMG